MRIGLFISCFIDAFFPEVGVATLKLLERFGHEVDSHRVSRCYCLLNWKFSRRGPSMQNPSIWPLPFLENCIVTVPCNTPL
jgi:hypothetical protein